MQLYENFLAEKDAKKFCDSLQVYQLNLLVAHLTGRKSRVSRIDAQQKLIEHHNTVKRNRKLLGK